MKVPKLKQERLWVFFLPTLLLGYSSWGRYIQGRLPLGGLLTNGKVFCMPAMALAVLPI